MENKKDGVIAPLITIQFAGGWTPKRTDKKPAVRHQSYGPPTPNHVIGVNEVADRLDSVYNDPSYDKQVLDEMMMRGADDLGIWKKHNIKDTEPYDRFRKDLHAYFVFTGYYYAPGNERIIGQFGIERGRREGVRYSDLDIK